MDYSKASSFRQRHQHSPALGRLCQFKSLQGRQEPRQVEASPIDLLLHIRQVLDRGQELLRAEDFEC
jgi:hypothetical protein